MLEQYNTYTLSYLFCLQYPHPIVRHGAMQTVIPVRVPYALLNIGQELRAQDAAGNRM
jgi:hypothetical protein